MTYDIIIIGSGLGGLECARLLSSAGRSVLVLEREAQLGGCLQSYRRNGMAYDTGFHYVGGLAEGQSLHGAFGRLGLLGLPWQRLDADGFDRVTIGGRTFAFAEGYDNFAERLAEDFPHERAALHRYAGLLRRSSEEQAATLRGGDAGASFREWSMETGAWQYLVENFRDPLLINVLSGTSLKMELRRESLPLFSFLHGNAGFVESSWRLRGDGSMIADALADGIRRDGGEIVCRAEVQELTAKDGRLTAAVCSNGETYEGRMFISDVHPAQTCRMIQGMKRSYSARMARAENSFGMFTVSLRIRPQTLRYFNHNHYVYRRPDVWTFYREDGPVGGVLVSCRVPEEGTGGFVRQVDLLTPMTWDRCRAWSDTVVGRRGVEYEKMKERVADECVALAEQVVPGLAAMTEERYTSTPLTWRDYTMTPCGSAYGMRKDFRSPLTTFLSPRTPIPNLLLTGQNVGLHGIHGVTMTAIITTASPPAPPQKGGE